MYPDCLKDLVGITTDPQQCFDGSGIINTSSLGLFVNEDPAWDNCRLKGGDTYCELLKLAAEMREEALRIVNVDVAAMLAGKVNTKQDCHYSIGQPERGSYYAPSLVPADPSITIYTEKVQGAYIRLDRLALMILPTAGPLLVDLRVYKIVPESVDVLMHTWQIPVTTISTTPKPIISYVIPCDGNAYRIEYTYNPETMQVLSSNYHCGCGDKLKCARGFILENTGEDDKKAYGISFYATIFCAPDELVCGAVANYTYKLVVAHMIRKKTITLLLTKIINKQDVNRWTLLSPEDIQTQLAAYNAEYVSRLEWLSEQPDFYTNSSCYGCSGGRMTKFNMLTGR